MDLLENFRYMDISSIVSGIGTAPGGIFITDTDGCFLYKNNKWCEMPGMVLEEAITDGGINVVHPDDRARVLSEWQRMINYNDTWELEYRLIAPSGKVIWIEGIAYAVYDLFGKVSGYIGINTDITERKVTQEMLAKADEQSRHLIRVLQETIVPSVLPAIPSGYEIAVRYRPALSEAEICGDFYDVFEMGEGKIGIIIGDIAGKGLQAATHISAVRHTIRSYAFLYDSPAIVMTLVSDALFKDITDENDMMTVFFAVLDIASRRLTYTKAGHEPPVLKRSDGSVEYLNTGGPMLTGLEKFSYLEDSVFLHSEDILVLFTDGLTDARKIGTLETFNREGILSSLSSGTSHSCAEEIASRLIEDALLFSDGVLIDDTTVVVMSKLT